MEDPNIYEQILSVVASHAFNVILILVLAAVAHNLGMKVMHNVVKRALQHEKFKTRRDAEQRLNTLMSTINAAVRAIVWVIAVLLLLAEFGINIGPLVAGAGIAGIALGFGAQTMVKDFLSGFFVLTENHYRVGDVVEINQTVSGVVENVTLRETVLRDLDGMVHHISNGEITISTNMTMEFAGVNLDVGVGYDTDLDKLEKIINQVGKDISEDEKFKSDIIDAPEFLRVDDFADSAIIVKITGKTAPMKQWAVTGELRKRLKIAFDKNGIEIPFPQRVIHNSPKTKK